MFLLQLNESDNAYLDIWKNQHAFLKDTVQPKLNSC